MCSRLAWSICHSIAYLEGKSPPKCTLPLSTSCSGQESATATACHITSFILALVTHKAGRWVTAYQSISKEGREYIWLPFLMKRIYIIESWARLHDAFRQDVQFQVNLECGVKAHDDAKMMSDPLKLETWSRRTALCQKSLKSSDKIGRAFAPSVSLNIPGVSHNLTCLDSILVVRRKKKPSVMHFYRLILEFRMAGL